MSHPSHTERFGPLMTSIGDLSNGRIDVHNKSHALQTNLDSLLQSYVTREKIYTDAVKNLQEIYGNVLMEAEQIANDIKATAAGQAEEILTTAKQEAEAWETEKANLATVQHFEPRIKLDVGGVKHTTSLTTLRRFPDTMIGAMFSGRHALPLDEKGYHFIDRDGTHFKYILNFLRSPEKVTIEITGAALSELKGECEYYGLLDLMFPFKPIAAFSVNNAYGNSVSLVQDQAGIWMVNNVPVKVCKYCGVADYTASGLKGIASYHYISDNFPSIVRGKGGVVVSEQPRPFSTCISCDRA